MDQREMEILGRLLARGPYYYNPGSRFVLVQPYGTDLLVQSLDTQVQMVVTPSCVTNDVQVANQAWRSWMQANGLLEQYEQQQREIAQKLAEQKAQQEAAAQRQAEQQAVWQRHGDPYSFEQVVDAPAEPPAQTALQRQAEQEYQAALQLTLRRDEEEQRKRQLERQIDQVRRENYDRQTHLDMQAWKDNRMPESFDRAPVPLPAHSGSADTTASLQRQLDQERREEQNRQERWEEQNRQTHRGQPDWSSHP